MIDQLFQCLNGGWESLSLFFVQVIGFPTIDVAKPHGNSTKSHRPNFNVSKHIRKIVEDALRGKNTTAAAIPLILEDLDRKGVDRSIAEYYVTNQHLLKNSRAKANNGSPSVSVVFICNRLQLLILFSVIPQVKFDFFWITIHLIV